MKVCKAALAILMTLAVVESLNAQWVQSSELGSYQAILARAGYAEPPAPSVQEPTFTPAPSPAASPQSFPNLAPPQSPVANQPYTPTDLPPFGPYSNNSSLPHPDSTVGQVGSGNLAAASTGRDELGCCETDLNCAVPQQRNAAWTFGVFGVTWQRDYEDRRRLAYNASSNLYTDDVSNGTFSGLGFNLGKRKCNGRGWETTYWGLSTANEVYLTGPTYTYLGGLSQLNHVPSGWTVDTIYNAGDSVRLFRETRMHNFEFNFLQNGGCYRTRRGCQGQYELLAGFRLFKFDEDYSYETSTSAAGMPAVVAYNASAENTLAGIQFGGRSEICLSQRFQLNGGVTFGLFNNHIQTEKCIVDETGYSPLIATGAAAGQPFHNRDTKNDAAALGQFDLGLAYRMTCRTRFRVGYRVMGLTGVALAANQLQTDFTDPYALGSANSNGGLLMHGLVYGIEFCR